MSKDFVVADMHDGDMKRITFGKMSTDTTVPMMIRPHGNNQTWTVELTMNVSDSKVEGIVDFHVPGKPNPPPCNLTVALWTEVAGGNMKGDQKRTLEFTDHTGTITHDPTFPLNTWVEIPAKP